MMNKKVHAFTDDVLGTLDASGVANAIKNKQFSAAEAVEAAIRRVENVNGILDAVVVKAYDDARKLNIENKDGVFYGVPSFIKDSDNLKGYPTQLGTGVFKARNAGSNSRFVKQFFSTGVANLGKTRLPEFGLLCSAENERWGIARNPWNTDYTPGGSSSGSAALVASGAVPIASGNDGAGSTRIPASICGLVGLKPSRHRLKALEGMEFMPIHAVHQGVLTRTVRDTAAFYGAAEQYYLNSKLPPVGYITEPLKKRLKVVMFDGPSMGNIGHTDEDTRENLKKTALLLESLGHHVEHKPLPFNMEDMVQHFLTYYGFFSYVAAKFTGLTNFSKVDSSQLDPFTVGISQEFKSNFWGLIPSIRKLKSEARKFDQIFNQYDIVMSPVLAHNTPKIGHFSTYLSQDELRDRAMNYAPYTGMQNISGSPAISLPLASYSNGMPMGIHFIAAYGQDKLLLELAYELEAAQPFKKIYESI
jgi:amidase